MKNKHLLPAFALLLGLSACQSKEEILRDQYAVEGMVLYQKHCENCHQAGGKGLKSLYPALNQGLFNKFSEASLALMMSKGIKEGQVLDGKTFTQYMPGNPALQALDLAEILTYLHELNGNKTKRVEVDRLKRWLKP